MSRATLLCSQLGPRPTAYTSWMAPWDRALLAGRAQREPWNSDNPDGDRQGHMLHRCSEDAGSEGVFLSVSQCLSVFLLASCCAEL